MFWSNRVYEYKIVLDRLISANTLGVYKGNEFYIIHSYEVGDDGFRFYGDKLLYECMEIISNVYTDYSFDIVDNITLHQIHYTISELIYWSKLYIWAKKERESILYGIQSEITTNKDTPMGNTSLAVGDFVYNKEEIYYLVNLYKQGLPEYVSISNGVVYKKIKLSFVKKIQTTNNLLNLLELYKTIVESRMQVDRNHNIFLDIKRS